MDDVTAVRLRLADIVKRAETDPDFAKALADDPDAVLAEEQIPDGAVEDFSEAFEAGRLGRDPALADEAFDPTGCIHTVGCNDFTCFSSNCPATCHVTIHLLAPDA